MITGHIAPPPSPIVAAEGVIRAAMEHGHSTPAEIAAAQESAGILFSPALAAAVASAAREQAHAGDQAEAADTARSLRVGLSARVEAAIARLLADHPDEPAMDARVLGMRAAQRLIHGGAEDADHPLPLVWDRSAEVPGPGDDATAGYRVSCHTAAGSPAVLVLDRENAIALGSLLGAEVRDIYAPCPTQGCGMSDEDLDTSDPAVWGWILARVNGIDGPGRWRCSPMCVSDAIARAGQQLADEDQADELEDQRAGEPMPPDDEAGKDTPTGESTRASELDAARLAVPPYEDMSLPPQLREALRTMAKRGQVVELTGHAGHEDQLAADPYAESPDAGKTSACDRHGAWHAMQQHCVDWPCPDCDRICRPEPGLEGGAL